MKFAKFKSAVVWSAWALVGPVAPVAEAGEYQGIFRMDRMFFEKSLKGEIRVNTGSSAVLDQRSTVEWTELPPTAAEPGPGAIADFRDFQGCARYVESGPVGLCFTIMPDVSNVDVKEGKVQLEGANWMVEQAQARGDLSSECSAGEPKFADAKEVPKEAPKEASDADAVEVTFSIPCGSESVDAKLILQST